MTNYTLALMVLVCQIMMNHFGVGSSWAISLICLCECVCPSLFASPLASLGLVTLVAAAAVATIIL